MIYASSAATYGNAESPQRVGRESPQNVYGFSKLSMDHLSREYIKKNDISSSLESNQEWINIRGMMQFL